MTAETPVKTVERAASLLRILAAQSTDGGRLSDVARAASLGKSTAHRLLSALVDVGFAAQEAATQRYHLGFELVRLGQSARGYEIVELARPALQELAALTEDTVFASIREGAEAVCVDRQVGAFPIRTLTLDVGDRRPLGVGAGSLALLAALPEAERQEVVAANETRLANYPGFDRSALLAFAAEAALRGFALNEGRIVPGMCGVGVAIRDRHGTVYGALSAAAIKERMGPDRIATVAGHLRVRADALAVVLERRRAAPREVA